SDSASHAHRADVIHQRRGFGNHQRVGVALEPHLAEGAAHVSLATLEAEASGGISHSWNRKEARRKFVHLFHVRESPRPRVAEARVLKVEPMLAERKRNVGNV